MTESQSISPIDIGEHVNSLDSHWFSYNTINTDLKEIETTSEELIREIIELATSEALNESAPVIIAGGHVYDRKGYHSYDGLGGYRNPSYGSKNSDVELQITVRIPFAKAEKIVEALTEERVAREEAAAQKKREEIDAQIARLQAERGAL